MSNNPDQSVRGNSAKMFLLLEALIEVVLPRSFFHYYVIRGNESNERSQGGFILRVARDPRIGHPGSSSKGGGLQNVTVG